jgi:hypothetical protein
MAARGGIPLSVLSLMLWIPAARAASPQPHFKSRLDHTPLGTPNLSPGLFITYTGVLTGSFQPESSRLPFDAAQCAGGSGTYLFTDTANSTLRVGINPPSVDLNPIFFMIQQEGSMIPLLGQGAETISPKPTQAPTEPGSGTLGIRQEAADPVLPPGTTHGGGFKNLLFASLYTICTQDSRPFGMFARRARANRGITPCACWTSPPLAC